jgi:hypothetical protein
VGTCDGVKLGRALGCTVGLGVGLKVGRTVGALVGDTVRHFGGWLFDGPHPGRDEGEFFAFTNVNA